MKTFYIQYNKDIVDDQVIKEQMEKLSKGKVSFDLDRIRKENLLDVTVKDKKPLIANNGNNNVSNNSSLSNERRSPDRMGKNMKNMKKRRK